MSIIYIWLSSLYIFIYTLVFIWHERDEYLQSFDQSTGASYFVFWLKDFFFDFRKSITLHWNFTSILCILRTYSFETFHVMQSISTLNYRGDRAINILTWESFAFLLRFESYLYFFYNLFYNFTRKIIIFYLIKNHSQMANRSQWDATPSLDAAGRAVVTQGSCADGRRVPRAAVPRQLRAAAPPARALRLPAAPAHALHRQLAGQSLWLEVLMWTDAEYTPTVVDETFFGIFICTRN